MKINWSHWGVWVAILVASVLVGVGVALVAGGAEREITAMESPTERGLAYVACAIVLHGIFTAK